MRIGGTVQVLWIGVAFALVAVADLHDELSVGSEFNS
jgi:hypothetical protein